MFSDSDLTYFLSHYMTPVTEPFHGYQVKTQFKPLLPPVNGRPESYCLTPYCLPTYNPVFKLAMDSLAKLELTARQYVGAFNDKLQNTYSSNDEN